MFILTLISSKIKGEGMLTLIGGSTTTTTGDGALYSIQHLNQPVIQFALTTTSTLDSVNLYLRSDATGTVTNFKAIVTIS